MSTRAREVQEFFDETHRYLSNDVGIRLRAEIVRDLLGGVRNARILDVGCGDGSISLQFLGAQVSLTLLDVSAKMLDVARHRTATEHMANVQFVQGDLLNYAIEKPYDIVICLGVLAHVDDVDDAIQQLARAVEPGGVCVLQFTDQRKLAAKLESGTYTLRRWLGLERRYPMRYLTMDGVLETTRRIGLSPVHSRRYSLLLPGMGRLPLGLLYRFQRLTLRNAWLSRHGSEVVFLLKKDATG